MLFSDLLILSLKVHRKEKFLFITGIGRLETLDSKEYDHHEADNYVNQKWWLWFDLGYGEYMHLCDIIFLASLYQSQVLLQWCLFREWRDMRDWLDLKALTLGTFCTVFTEQRLSRMRSQVGMRGHVVHKIVQEYQVFIYIKGDIISFSTDKIYCTWIRGMG